MHLRWWLVVFLRHCGVTNDKFTVKADMRVVAAPCLFYGEPPSSCRVTCFASNTSSGGSQNPLRITFTPYPKVLHAGPKIRCFHEHRRSDELLDASPAAEHTYFTR